MVTTRLTVLILSCALAACNLKVLNVTPRAFPSDADGTTRPFSEEASQATIAAMGILGDQRSYALEVTKGAFVNFYGATAAVDGVEYPMALYFGDSDTAVWRATPPAVCKDEFAYQFSYRWSYKGGTIRTDSLANNGRPFTVTVSNWGQLVWRSPGDGSARERTDSAAEIRATLLQQQNATCATSITFRNWSGHALDTRITADNLVLMEAYPEHFTFDCAAEKTYRVGVPTSLTTGVFRLTAFGAGGQLWKYEITVRDACAF